MSNMKSAFTVMTQVLLTMNTELTMQRDRYGRTPLHFASSIDFFKIGSRWCLRLQCSPPFICPSQHPLLPLMKVFQANPEAFNQADNNGFFPIHAAASEGVLSNIQVFLKKFPYKAGLRDSKGRTFLHIAVERNRMTVVSFVCQTPRLAWILNMQDNSGNTALHLAVMSVSFRVFCALFGNREVNLNLSNNDGKTPRDISRNMIPPGMYFLVSNAKEINNALTSAGATQADVYWDYIDEKHSVMGNVTDKMIAANPAQTICIGSTLIATMAFGATFALPGGYRADDHTNGGTPTLAGRYVFDAFMMATTLAFICSSTATVGLIYSETLVDLRTRRANLGICMFLVGSSVTSLPAAFALGVYMVLAPVARHTAIAICLSSPLLVLYRNTFILLRTAILARPLCIRLGIVQALLKLAVSVITSVFVELWPLIVIFGWAAFARINQHS
uniref:PGG domain-containing protein n=1 Tax=Hordeum vulgare subsp. vulgare TaxID=112509 RepID=A0A8I7BFR9_HORVV